VTIITSADGLTWQRRDSGTPGLLHGIAYGRGKFVAVGLAGLVLTSSNGMVWSEQDSGKLASLRSVTFGNDIFVAGRSLRSYSNVPRWSGLERGLFWRGRLALLRRVFQR